MSCDVCTEKFNKSTRAKVTCPWCPFNQCVTCAEKYILGHSSDPHCMNCTKGWSRETLHDNFSLKFINRDLKARREALLFERERSLMPETQPYVEAELKVRHHGKNILEINKRVDILKQEVSKIYSLPLGPLAVEHGLSNDLEADILRHSLVSEKYKAIRVLECDASHHMYAQQVWTNGGTRFAQQNKRQFVRACPANGCSGFLSTAWKCGLCEVWACPDCHEVKGTDRDAPHTCDRASIATAQLLAKDSRNCPKCASMIFKINGCFAKDTPVPMFDGSVKMSQNITQGDVLIGDDGNPREVLATCTGQDTMYKVRQNKGVEYVVNSKHKLVLKFSGDRKVYTIGPDYVVRWFDQVMKTKKFKNVIEAEEFCKTLIFPEEIEILVEDYIKLGDSTKKFLLGFKSSGVDWPKKNVRLDPYIMGLWIGDGTSFAANDSEILQYILEWAEKNSAEVVHSGPYKFDIRRRNGAQYNPLKHSLDSYNLVRNKHVPTDYIVNDRTTRLAVLAGLIDSDGNVSNGGKRAVIIQTCPTITKQIEFLARSLGFNVSVTACERKNVKIFGGEPKNYRDSHKINISGEHLGEIPTRKKCVNSTPNKDGLRTSIEVEAIGSGTYYGWMVNRNKRFVLGDLTVVRNCDQMWCTQCHTAFSWNTGRIEEHRVHNPHYYDWMRQNGGLPREPGDVPCGGLPPLERMRMTLGNWNGSRYSQDTRTIAQKHLWNIHRIHAHIQWVVQGRYIAADHAAGNRDLRVKFMLKDFTEDIFKKKLQQREKASEKKEAIRQVLDMYQAVTIDLFRTLQEDGNCEEALRSFTNLKDHANECFSKISRRFTNCATPIIRENFDCY